jgi:hypothetical protein
LELVNLINFANIISSSIAGLIVIFIIFIYKEKIKKITDFSGLWYIKTVTKETKYNTYKEMILIYQITLLQKGQDLEGTAEKIYEKTEKKGSKKYIGKKRICSKVEGYIERNYFGADKIFIHAIEKGQERESTIFYTISKKCGKFEGSFTATAGDSKGSCIWQRTSFC